MGSGEANLDRDDELLHLDLKGEDGLLHVLDGAAGLVGLGTLEGGYEGVGEGGESGGGGGGPGGRWRLGSGEGCSLR